MKQANDQEAEVQHSCHAIATDKLSPVINKRMSIGKREVMENTIALTRSAENEVTPPADRPASIKTGTSDGVYH